MKTALLILGTTLLFACSSQGGGANSATPASSVSPKASTAVTAAPSATVTASATASAAPSAAPSASAAASAAAAPAEIGVPECDAFIKVMNDCFLPAQSARAFETEKEVLDEKIEAWTKAAATPQGKAGMAKVCKTEADMWKDKLAGAKCKLP